MSNIRYNITTNDGDASSVTVFIDGDSQVATKDHPQFDKIVAALEGGETDPAKIRGLFDVGHAIITKFAPLSERVSIASGRLFLDGDPMDGALSQTIVRYHAAGDLSFEPLVAFLEKIQTNPNEHSREHLFRWLRDRNIGICPDGDFIAYKGIKGDDRSDRAGEAIVNGTVVKGRIPNLPDTIIEMPRSQVTFDPRHGCSTGLHAGTWQYASTFAPKKLIVKINPRDVVSVPTDSQAQKLRVCRYRVLKVTTSEDKDVLFVPDVERLAVVPSTIERAVAEKPRAAKKRAAAKKQAPAKKAAPAKRVARVKKASVLAKRADLPTTPDKHKFPKYYEEFKTADWRVLTAKQIAWVAKQWEIPGYSKLKKDDLIKRLMRESVKRRKTWGAAR